MIFRYFLLILPNLLNNSYSTYTDWSVKNKGFFINFWSSLEMIELIYIWTMTYPETVTLFPTHFALAIFAVKIEKTQCCRHGAHVANVFLKKSPRQQVCSNPNFFHTFFDFQGIFWVVSLVSIHVERRILGP